MNIPKGFTPTTVDMYGQWDTIWSAFTGAFGTDITRLMSVIGTIVVIVAIAGLIWEKRRQGFGGQGMGGGQGMNKLWGALVAGTLLLAPEVILPFALKIADAIINFVLGFFD
jgi:hypothetical protein